MKMETGLTKQNIGAIANIDPTTAWLYAPSNRISIDNDNRNGFIVKGETDEKIAQLAAKITNVKPMNSHKQPNEKEKAKGAPTHNALSDWCESADGKLTTTRGAPCAGCPAFNACNWKMELTMNIAGREGDFLMTIPTVSSMRFKEAAQKVAKSFGLHFSQAIWLMTVKVEKSDDNKYPVVVFEPRDLNGDPLTGRPAPAADPLAGLREQLREVRGLVRAAEIEPQPALTQAQALALTADELTAAIATALEQLANVAA
jgi:hypothetical protein